jgi:hypothetical protein
LRKGVTTAVGKNKIQLPLVNAIVNSKTQEPPHPLIKADVVQVDTCRQQFSDGGKVLQQDRAFSGRLKENEQTTEYTAKPPHHQKYGCTAY